MNIRRSTLKVVLIVSLGIILIVMAVAVTARKWTRNISPGTSRPQKQDERVTDTLPPVISSIKGIEVVSAFIDGNGSANITVVNKTGKGIMTLAFSYGNSMFSDDYGLTQDNPKTLIPPYSSYTFYEPVSNLRAHTPIRASAVLYDDGTEEGDADVRKNIHDARDHERERRILESKKGKGN
jgi:hypothetical protein